MTSIIEGFDMDASNNIDGNLEDLAGFMDVLIQIDLSQSGNRVFIQKNNDN